MALHKMDFYGVNFLHGVKEASFDSNLFSSFYEYASKVDITFFDHELLDLKHPFTFFISFLIFISFFELFYFFFKFLFYVFI
jgi:hypothetical protein